MEESKQPMFLIESPDEIHGTDSFSSIGNDVKRQILADNSNEQGSSSLAAGGASAGQEIEPIKEEFMPSPDLINELSQSSVDSLTSP